MLGCRGSSPSRDVHRHGSWELFVGVVRPYRMISRWELRWGVVEAKGSAAVVVSVLLLGMALAPSEAAACISYDGRSTIDRLLVRRGVIGPTRPTGDEHTASWLANAKYGGTTAVEAALFARRILRADGQRFSIATIDGQPAERPAQLALARTLLETLWAQDRNNARVGTDLGELLSNSRHQADRIRGLNLLVKLNRRGTITTAHGYAALGRVWTAAGVPDEAAAALAQCRLLTRRMSLCSTRDAI